MFWLQTLAAKFLHRTGASVLVNMEISGDAYQMTSNGLIYVCDLHGKFYLCNGEEFDVPKGKFRHRSKGDKRSGR